MKGEYHDRCRKCSRGEEIVDITSPYIIHRLALDTQRYNENTAPGRENHAHPQTIGFFRAVTKNAIQLRASGDRKSPRRGSLMQQLARVNARRSNSHFLSIAATIPPRKRPIIRRFITRARACAAGRVADPSAR